MLIKKLFRLVNHLPMIIWMGIINIILLIENTPLNESLLVNFVWILGYVLTIFCGLMYPKALKD